MSRLLLLDEPLVPPVAHLRRAVAGHGPFPRPHHHHGQIVHAASAGSAGSALGRELVQALLQPALRFLDAKMLVERLQILRGLWLWAASCRIELVQALLQRAHCSLAGKVHVEGLRPLPGLRLCSSAVG